MNNSYNCFKMTDFYTYTYYDGDTPIYIGKGTRKRAYRHLKRKDMHPLTHKLAKMKREGREPIIEIFPMPSEEAAFELEMLWIALFGRKDLGLGPLLNLTDGGEGEAGRHFSPSHRMKLSVASTGKPRSPEHCASMRKPKSAAGKANMSISHNKPCTIDGIMIYPSRKALVAVLGQGKAGSGHPDFRYLSGPVAK